MGQPHVILSCRGRHFGISLKQKLFYTKIIFFDPLLGFFLFQLDLVNVADKTSNVPSCNALFDEPMGLHFDDLDLSDAW